MLSVTVLLSTLELLRFREALALGRPSAVSERAFLVVRSFVFRSGSISRLGRFVKGFSEQFFVIRKSRFPLSLITWSKTGEVAKTHTTVQGPVSKRKMVCQRSYVPVATHAHTSTTDRSAKPEG